MPASSSSTPTHLRPSRHQQQREDRLITFYARAWEFFDRHKTMVYAALAGLVVLVLLAAGYVYYRSVQQEEAQQRLGQILSVYESGDYQMALDGTGDRVGLLAIADDYSVTPAGNLATFYAADALYQLGEYERALDLYEDYDISSDILGAGALAAQAAIYENREQFVLAAQHYLSAANAYESQATAPGYLLSAGRAYEEADRYEQAVDAYDRLRSDYPDTPAAQQALAYRARALAAQP